MKLTQWQTALFLIINLFVSSLGQAQTPPSTPNQTGTGYFDLGVKTGYFFPNGIEGVRESLPVFGVKVGHSVGKTTAFEYDIDFSNAKGVSYFLAYASLRHDFAVGNVIPLFFLIGVDVHNYRRADSYGEITQTRTEYDRQTQFGWHLGFGGETNVYGNLFLRADVRMGFSPGDTLTVTIGGVYRFK